MNKILKGIAAVTLAFGLSTGAVDAATATKRIDASACETVYTNYYFFLDANTVTYFNQGELKNVKYNTIAEYHNNSYQIKNFDTNNIGYGQVALSPTTSTSKDGITSMSLSDYYTYFKKSGATNGAFSSGTNNYIVSHDWYKVLNENTYESKGDSTLPLTSYSLKTLMDATINATSTITRNTSIVPTVENPFQLRIDRNYYGYLTGQPLTYGTRQWYLHPAVYYVQYCSPKQTNTTPVETYYHITYLPNTTDVVIDMPDSITVNTKEDSNISSLIPKRNGYTFLGWNPDAKSTEANHNYDSNAPYRDRKDLVLYAVWKKNDTPVTPSDPKPTLPDNPQTGVEHYILPFGGAVGAASVALSVLKKKKGFKQF